MSITPLPDHPNLDQFKKQAKDLLKALHANRPDALQRVHTFHPHAKKLTPFTLSDAQLVIAREYGFPTWPRFAKHIAASRSDARVIWKLAQEAVIHGDA